MGDKVDVFHCFLYGFWGVSLGFSSSFKLCVRMDLLRTPKVMIMSGLFIHPCFLIADVRGSICLVWF